MNLMQDQNTVSVFFTKLKYILVTNDNNNKITMQFRADIFPFSIQFILTRLGSKLTSWFNLS